MTIQFTLNKKSVNAEVGPEENLFSLLRRLGCMSVKCGCDSSQCGMCTVLVNNKPMLSCSFPAPRVSGMEVTTLEGLQEEADDFASCMADEGSDQCGFCNPGFVMSVLAMERELNDPTEEEIRKYLLGNYCRCTGYVSQMRAIKKYLQMHKRG